MTDFFPDPNHDRAPDAIIQEADLDRVSPVSNTDIDRRLRLSLPNCMPVLRTYYAGLVVTTGSATTADDATRAWLSWVYGQGARPTQKITPDTWRDGFQDQCASAVRACAQYFPTREATS